MADFDSGETEIMAADWDAAHADTAFVRNATRCHTEKDSAPFDHSWACAEAAMLHARGRHAGAPMLVKAEKENDELRSEIRSLKRRIDVLISEESGQDE